MKVEYTSEISGIMSEIRKYLESKDFKYVPRGETTEPKTYSTFLSKTHFSGTDFVDICVDTDYNITMRVELDFSYEQTYKVTGYRIYVARENDYGQDPNYPTHFKACENFCGLYKVGKTEEILADLESALSMPKDDWKRKNL